MSEPKKRGRPSKVKDDVPEIPNGYTVTENDGKFIIRQSGNVVHVEDSQDRVDQYIKMVTGQ